MTETVSIYGPVADDLPLVGNALRELAADRHPLLGETLAHVFGTSGKLIRPALVMLAGRLGEYDRDRLVTLAASLEVVHTASLVHDDTIDQALSRRGLSTVSALWDSKVAILVGDFLFAQSAELAARLDSVRIMALLSETVMDMTAGELRQYAASQVLLVDEADYFERIKGKTAGLFRMCCEGAAIVSRQSPLRVEALRRYGFELGLAFQIADDVLDFTGDAATLGKAAGSDLRQGTVTLPLVLFAEGGLPASLRGGLTPGGDVEPLVAAVRNSGAPEAALRRAEEHAQAARDALAVFPESEAREALLHLTSQVVYRNR